MILPNIPHTSQNEHLSIQCGGENELQMSSWSKPAIPGRSDRLTQSICLSNSAPIQACPSNSQKPTLHLSQCNTMTSTAIQASEDQQVDEDDPFSCTLKNVIMDHLVHLLPVYPNGHSSPHNHLSIQCGHQEDPVSQSHTPPAAVPSAGQKTSIQTNIGDVSITDDLPCIQGPINSKGQPPCPMGGR